MMKKKKKKKKNGSEGIRTHDSEETGPLNHSATLPDVLNIVNILVLRPFQL